MSTAHVYEAIANVAKAMAQDGISKDRENQQQRYKFRGVDDVMNALATPLSSQGLIIFPRVITHRTEERATKSGGSLNYTFAEVEFDFVSAKDGSKHTAKTVGEAMDSADKSTNKALSAAYKYVCFQVFCIPTEGDHDADAHTPEPAPRVKPQPQTPSPVSPVDTARARLDALECFDEITKQVNAMLEKLGGNEPNDTQRAILAIGADRMVDTAMVMDDMALVSPLLSRLHLQDKARIEKRIAAWTPRT